MLTLLLFGAAAAQAPVQAQDLPQAVLDASVDWGACRGAATAPLLRGPLSPEEIADAAIAACTAEEQRLAAAGMEHFGPSWRAVVADFRTRYRTEMLTRIPELRSGAPPSDPHAAWGRCLGEGMQTVEADESEEAAADRILDRCAAQQERVRAHAQRSQGAENAQIMIEAQRQALRTRTIDEIRAARR